MDGFVLAAHPGQCRRVDLWRLIYGASDDRAKALPHWLDCYNEARPHSSIGDRPARRRVHDVSVRNLGAKA